ncbi:MAG: phytanoyl-CoA dioxygenase family protein [Candidatus Competibacteraceae bacterium]|nr:phytanoyl-CoA dioxygenase family protein [Candidatus Competibacteraceae bacterium]MCB1808301.1 phytanoyl-CoA dioxygenase family protein [Candidatus Competibacteraceae bacterium]MCB1815638.1 phytanoyl-CoA dioxygenase family protein [Candidatus Competibacteraceae bacterium]
MCSLASKPLSTAQVERYQQDGVLFPVPVLTGDYARQLSTRYVDFQNQAKDQFGSGQRFKVHLLATWLYDIVSAAPLLDAVEQILGPDILCWSTDFFAKPAHTPGFVSLHQDSTYAGLEPADGVLNAWVAFTPTSPANGCLRVVRGSHRLGQLAHANTYGENNMLFFGQQAELDYRDDDVLDVCLQPGQASFHHMQVVHGSGPNNSDGPRIGMVIRYMRPDVKQQGPRDSATLLRGHASDHFDLEPAPKADFDATAIAAFRDAITRPSGLGDNPV